MLKNMLQNQKKYNIPLVISTVCCVALLLIRNIIVGNKDYNFLLWNLFLAIIPFIIAFLLESNYKKFNKLTLLLGGFFWLLFYPNAPYMVSDLIHVNKTSSIVLYDTLIIFSLSTLALFFGFYSLKLIYIVIKKSRNHKFALSIMCFSILLSSFGIFLGRILRLNSWDIFTKPIQTLILIFDHLFPITKNPTTYLIIILFSFVQFMVLYLVQGFKHTE